MPVTWVSSLSPSPLAPNWATERVMLAYGLFLYLKEPSLGLDRGSFNPLSNPSTMIRFKTKITIKAEREDPRDDEDAITERKEEKQ